MHDVIARIATEYESLRARHEERHLKPPIGFDFSSNDYLALSRHPNIIAAVKNSLVDEGYGSTSSRFIRGERFFYRGVEDKLAHFKKTKRALLFPSGYAANIGVLSSLIKKGDVVFSDQFNHASIIDGLRLSGATIHIFPHLDLDHIRHAVLEIPRTTPKFLVTEALFSMDGDQAPLDRYAQLCSDHNLSFIVDEAHSVGLFGEKGAGLIDHFAISDQVLVSINGLGKAFGCYGAFVAGNELVVNYLLQRARTLMFTTGLPPSSIAAINAALDIVENGNDLRKQLFNNVTHFRNFLDEAQLVLPHKENSPILPVIVNDSERTKIIAEKMSDAGFDVRAIRPPTVQKNSARLRITINITHTEHLMRDFVHHLEKLL